MSERKTDGRVKYTKLVVRDSFISLLRDKPVAKITVTEICRKAEINRATFYSHWTDPLALLHSIENEIIDEITQKLSLYTAGEDNMDLKGTLVWVFEYIRDNADICDLLLSDTSDTSFQQQIMTMLERELISAWLVTHSATQEDAEYIFSFASIGSIGLIRKWIADDFRKTPEQMADMLMKLSQYGYSAY